MQKPKPTWVAVMAGFENQVDMLCIYVAPEDMYETCKACVDAVKEVWEGYDPPPALRHWQKRSVETSLIHTFRTLLWTAAN
jgi:hypothetical protein